LERRSAKRIVALRVRVAFRFFFRTAVHVVRAHHLVASNHRKHAIRCANGRRIRRVCALRSRAARRRAVGLHPVGITRPAPSQLGPRRAVAGVSVSSKRSSRRRGSTFPLRDSVKVVVAHDGPRLAGLPLVVVARVLQHELGHNMSGQAHVDVWQRDHLHNNDGTIRPRRRCRRQGRGIRAIGSSVRGSGQRVRRRRLWRWRWWRCWRWERWR